MNTNRQKSNWLLDTLLFGGFIACFFLDLTGMSLHQWVGVCGGVLSLYHLVLHWDWVNAVSRRFFGKTSGQARTYYLLDAVILVGFFLIIFNGLVISTWLNLPLANYVAWKDFHVVSSLVTLALVVLKIGLHWRWIVRVARQPLFPPPAPAPRPVPVSGGMSRRDFLKLMGIVGAASLLAARSALGNGQAVQAAEPATTQADAMNAAGSAVQTATATSTPAAIATVPAAATTQAEATSTPALTATPAAATCVVRCDKHCSYPGQCRRYQDTNGNNLCDLGECL